MVAVGQQRLGELGHELPSEHRQILLLALIVMHLLAMVFYAVVRHKNLVPAMVHGDKFLSPLTTASSDTTARRVLALVIWLLSAALVLWTTALS